MVRVDVRDSGPGIPPDEKKRIFEAFHRMRQTDKASEGTGLGLAITRKLVDLHGGQLDVESEPGAGSCFFFTLPGACCTGQASNQHDETSASPKSQVKVLVVEDDLSSADLLESQLTSAGYQVVVCREPQQTVEVAAQVQPAVITLDVVMLPVNGWDVLSKLKSDPRTANIRVVMVTVMDQRSTGMLLGADDYIVKPVDKSLLLHAVDRCLSRREHSVGGNSVLVVEDDEATREFIVDLLTRSGYAVTMAVDGVQAQAQVQAHLPSLVILDLMLPEITGFELIAQWRDDPATAELPIFVLSNKDLTGEEKEYLRAHTGAQLSKHDQWKEELVRQIQRVAPLFAEA
jgi:DNA-binding response OmpR family regulator